MQGDELYAMFMLQRSVQEYCLLLIQGNTSANRKWQKIVLIFLIRLRMRISGIALIIRWLASTICNLYYTTQSCCVLLRLTYRRQHIQSVHEDTFSLAWMLVAVLAWPRTKFPCPESAHWDRRIPAGGQHLASLAFPSAFPSCLPSQPSSLCFNFILGNVH